MRYHEAQAPLETRACPRRKSAICCRVRPAPVPCAELLELLDVLRARLEEMDRRIET